MLSAPSFWSRKFGAYCGWKISVFHPIFSFPYWRVTLTFLVGHCSFHPPLWPGGTLLRAFCSHSVVFSWANSNKRNVVMQAVISAPRVPWPFTRSMCPQPEHLGFRPGMSIQSMGERGWLKTDEGFKFSLCSTVKFNLETSQNLSEITKGPWEISFFLLWLQI